MNILNRLRPGHWAELPSQTRVMINRAFLVVLVLAFVLVGIFSCVNYSNRVAAKQPVILSPAPEAPLFSESFADNHQGWLQGNTPDYSVSISNHNLNLKETSDHIFLQEDFPGKKNYSDFRIDVTLLFLRGDVNSFMGISFRCPTAPPGFIRGYQALVNGKGIYQLSKGVPPDPTSQNVSKDILLDEKQLEQVPQPGKPVTISIIARGPLLAMYIDNAYLVSVYDPTYSSGTLAISLYNRSQTQPMEAAVKSISIYPAPAVVPITQQ